MGMLIVSARVTVDGVMDQLEGWFVPEDESAEQGLEQLGAADALILGRGNGFRAAPAIRALEGLTRRLVLEAKRGDAGVCSERHPRGTLHPRMREAVRHAQGEGGW